MEPNKDLHDALDAARDEIVRLNAERTELIEALSEADRWLSDGAPVQAHAVICGAIRRLSTGLRSSTRRPAVGEE